MKEDILKLRAEKKTYNEIQRELGCSKSTISYHCGNGQKEKSRLRSTKRRTTIKGAISNKLDRFIKRSLYTRHRDFQRNRFGGRHIEGRTYNFTFDNVLNKIGENPTCYLTGDKIDLSDPSSYNFDHIIPVAKGGDSSLENLGLTTKNANLMKSDMTKEELLEMCYKVINYTLS